MVQNEFHEIFRNLGTIRSRTYFAQNFPSNLFSIDVSETEWKLDFEING